MLTDKRAIKARHIRGLKQRIAHRLAHRLEHLSAREVAFLLSMDEWLATHNWVTSNQGHWLLDILERTETKRLKQIDK